MRPYAARWRRPPHQRLEFVRIRLSSVGVGISLAALLVSTAAKAGGALTLPDRRSIHVASSSSVNVQSWVGNPLAAVAQDSFFLYGGPTSLEGKFQDAQGQPDRQGWTGVDRTEGLASPTVGEFSKVVSLLTVPDACAGAPSLAMAFIDDGTPPSNHLGESTGGSVSANWSYGVSGGWVVNFTGGLGQAGYGLFDEVWSPEIQWDMASTSADDAISGGLTLRYRVWDHLPLHNGIFHTWRVRSYPDPTSGGWSPWRDRSFVYYGEVPAWRVRDVEIGDLLVPLPEKLQVALGVVDLHAQAQLPGGDATPSPVFDDVALIKHSVDGPMITVREMDQFHDGFPRTGLAGGAGNLSDLAVRMDMARDINPAGVSQLAGDSMVVTVVPTIAGTVLTGPPIMTWFLRPNPLFDSVRQLPSGSVPVTNGWKGILTGAPSTSSTGQPIPSTWFFDLPDGFPRNSALLAEPIEPAMVFPGDKLWIFVEAHDNLGHTSFYLKDPGTHTLPNGEDCGGTSPKAAPKKPTQDPPVPKDPDPDALPGVWEGGIGKEPWQVSREVGGIATVQPRILVWDDTGRGQELALMELALAQNGVLRGRDFDVFVSAAAGSGVGDGLGGVAHGATPLQLTDYDVIFYLGGSASAPLLSDGTAASGNDKSNDIGLLQTWHGQAAPRAIVYFADNIGAAATTAGSVAMAYLQQVQGVDFVADDVSDQIDDQQVPAIEPTGLGSTTFLTSFAVDGACPNARAFDAILPRTGAVACHRFRSRLGSPISGPAAGVFWARLESVGGTSYRRWDVTFPFGFSAIRDDVDGDGPGTATSARARLVGELLGIFGHPGNPGDAVGTPPPLTHAKVGAAHPNPFNGSTSVQIDLSEPMVCSARVLDRRGRVVCTLVPPAVAVGPVQLSWNGLDGGGRPVASGVYSVEIRAGAQRELRSVTLVK